MDFNIKIYHKFIISFSILFIEINKFKNKKIKNILSKDALIGVAGLGASFATGGLTVFATILSGFHGYKNFTEYQNQIKENPSYFLWKIKKNANI